MATLYIANITTESLDHYTWLYTKRPSEEEIVKLLMDWYEIPSEDFEDYMDDTNIEIIEREVSKKELARMLAQ